MVDAAHELEDALPGRVIQIGGGLVRQHDARAGNERPSDGDALSLAATELIGAVSRVVLDADQFQVSEHALAALILVEPEVQQRILDVLRGRQHRHQIEGLEDEANLPGAQIGQLVGRLTAHVLVVHVDLSGRRIVYAPDQVEKRGLPASRGTGNRKKLAPIDREVHLMERMDALLAQHVIF